MPRPNWIAAKTQIYENRGQPKARGWQKTLASDRSPRFSTTFNNEALDQWKKVLEVKAIRPSRESAKALSSAAQFETVAVSHDSLKTE